MKRINIQYYQSPVGEMILGSYQNQLCLADWCYRKQRKAIDKRMHKKLDASYIEKQDALLSETITQLDEYFQQSRSEFTLPLLFVGSDFQKTVWQALCDIPYGNVANYTDLAKRIGNINAVRAVANANGANAISIIVPCHRIIGSNGALVGYAGGLSAKETLLQLENDMFSN